MGLFNSLGLYTEKYEGGLPDLKPPMRLQLLFKDSCVDLTFFKGIIEQKKIVLQPDDILEIGYGKEAYRSGGKAAAGAIIGGFLTGGLGLIAGAAIGGRRRKEQQLHLVIMYNGIKCELFLEPSKSMARLYTALKNLMAKQIKKPEAISENVAQHDLVGELEALHGLVEKGILTQEEFEVKKKQLLN